MIDFEVVFWRGRRGGVIEGRLELELLASSFGTQGLVHDEGHVLFCFLRSVIFSGRGVDVAALLGDGIRLDWIGLSDVCLSSLNGVW